MSLPLPLHHEAAIDLGLAPAAAFARLDDHRRLAAHMASPSLMMAGASMRIATDALNGQAVGSRIALSGRVLGIRLAVEEAVTAYDPPRRKVWETLGEPHLLVIGRYRMGFEVGPRAGGSRVALWIDYDLPRRGIGRWLGRWFGRWYAKWCVAQMLGSLAPT